MGKEASEKIPVGIILWDHCDTHASSQLVGRSLGCSVGGRALDRKFWVCERNRTNYRVRKKSSLTDFFSPISLRDFLSLKLFRILELSSLVPFLF